jgi:hypothetical protein
MLFICVCGGGVSDPLCLSSSLALHFSDYSFCVLHPVNWNDRDLLACAVASDFSVALQCLSKTPGGFKDQTPLLKLRSLYLYKFSKRSKFECPFIALKQGVIVRKVLECYLPSLSGPSWA